MTMLAGNGRWRSLLPSSTTTKKKKKNVPGPPGSLRHMLWRMTFTKDILEVYMSSYGRRRESVVLALIARSPFASEGKLPIFRPGNDGARLHLFISLLWYTSRHIPDYLSVEFSDSNESYEATFMAKKRTEGAVGGRLHTSMSRRLGRRTPCSPPSERHDYSAGWRRTK